MYGLARLQKLIIAFVVLSLPALCLADGDYFVGKKGEAIRDYVDPVYENLGFSGVILAARKGKVIAAIPRGSINDQAGTALKFTSLFEIGSCTKPFTAIAVLQLVDDGKISLDELFPSTCQVSLLIAKRSRSATCLHTLPASRGPTRQAMAMTLQKSFLHSCRVVPRRSRVTHSHTGTRGTRC